MRHIHVVGAGSWGTALALTAYRAGRSVTLHPRRAEHSADISLSRENKRYLPGVMLPEEISVTSSLEGLNKADLILLVTPAQTYKETVEHIKDHLSPSTPLVICSKGIDLKSHRLLSDILADELSNPLAVLSGPSFADEVGAQLPTAVVIASHEEPQAMKIARALSHPRFRLYASTDMIGVQIAGAVKNVLAIACGIVRGKKLGNNAAASLMTRGLAEMTRLGVQMGARAETFVGLAGMGDLALTASSLQSRNMSFGQALGSGQSIDEILGERVGVTEGVLSAKAVYQLAQAHHVSMPLCEAVYAIIHQQESIDHRIEMILARKITTEG